MSHPNLHQYGSAIFYLRRGSEENRSEDLERILGGVELDQTLGQIVRNVGDRPSEHGLRLDQEGHGCYG